MASNEGRDTGKGKTRGNSRDGSGSSTVGPAGRGESTPPPDGEGSRTSAGRTRSRSSLLMMRLWSSSVGEIQLPRGKSVCIFYVLVSVLALLRGFLVPIPGGFTGASGSDRMPTRLEDDLVRLVLAEELDSVAKTVQKETRRFDDLRARRARTLKEIQALEERLTASAAEVRELEGFGQGVAEVNNGDAELTTEVSRAQGHLRDLHRSVNDELDGLKQRLEGQAQTMRGVREGFANIALQRGNEEDRAAGAIFEELESRLEDYLNDLAGLHASLRGDIEQNLPQSITPAELEALLMSAAEPSDRTGTRGGNSGGEPDESDVEKVRAVSEEVVGSIVKRMVTRGPGGRSGGAGDGDECVSERTVLEEVGVAIGNLLADGTGLRDYANAGVGGKVLTSAGMTSDTYTPASWWGSSRYWHGAGVENGVGPVESLISEDSSLGACWAMSGSEGFVTVQLPREITVDAVSLEHASRMITTESGSAPMAFEVWGMRNTDDRFPAKLGSGMYDVDGRPIQTFPIEPLGVKFKLIQLKILSNWGNPDYTCLYRLRVHGRERM